jgi:hypothetical protein
VKVHTTRLEIDAQGLGHQDGHVGLGVHNGAYRLCDVGRRETGHGHLVQQGLKGVMVGAIDERYAHGRTRKRPSRRKAAKTAADDDYVGVAVGGRRNCQDARDAT